MTAERLHPNHAFVLDTAARFTGGRILDYGCGGGAVVHAGLKQGLDIYGTDVFYGGGHGDRERVSASGLLRDRVKEMDNDRTPFPDAFFSVVFHNQVFEHVPDLGRALKEIRRVLTPDGLMLSLFPSAEVIREGHCGVPFAHRLGRYPGTQYSLLLAARLCGLGYFHGSKSYRQWARDFSVWLRSWCYYRPERVVRGTYRNHGFSFESLEQEYALYRLAYTGRQWAIPFARNHPKFVRFLIHKLAGMVILSRREE